MTTSLTNNRLTTSSNFSQGGNGKYKPLRKRTTSLKSNSPTYNPFEPSYDRMRFKNSRDPIFIAFDHIDKQNTLSLTADFIKDGITDSISTIGKTLVQLFS